MKIKNIFSYIGLIIVMGMILTACTQDEQNSLGDKPYKTENGFYVYPVDFQCAVPGYDDEGKTRAMSYDWSNMTSLFARFQSGSNYYYGFMTYENNGWNLVSTTDFLELTTSGAIELYYFKESNGDYYYLNLNTECFDIYNNGSFVKSTSLAWNNNSFDFSEGTAVYLTRSGTSTYTHNANGGGFTVKATLEPGLWRMRFSGTNGTTITMPAEGNDIAYLSAFNWYGSDDVSFSGGTKDISLKVSNNYTPYIYGQFSSSSSNKITVKNGNDTFTRNLSATNLYAGKSGCFTLPTSSNYSSAGWTKVTTTQEMVLADFLEKPFGIVDVNLKTDSYNTIKEKLSSLYTLFDSSDDPTHSKSLMIFVRYNDNLNNLVYHEIPLYSLYVSNSYVGYGFETSKDNLSDVYPTLDQIVKDFNDIGIPMSYEKKNETYTKAEGTITVGNIRYTIMLTEYDTAWHIDINMYISNVDPNATIEPDPLVTFIDGMVTGWKIGSTVNTFNYYVYKKAEAEALTDDELAEEIYSRDPLSKDAAGNIYRHNNAQNYKFYSPNTQYYMCAVAKNSSGKRGPVCRYLFKTNAEGLPSAPISNIKAASTTKWTYDIALKNGAKSYYLGTSADENTHNNLDWHFWAYYVYNWATAGQIEPHDWTSVYTTLDYGTCNVFTIGTWGIGSNNSIGNPEVAYGSTSSLARAWTRKAPKSTVQEEAIPRADLEKMMENTRLYRVTQ